MQAAAGKLESCQLSIASRQLLRRAGAWSRLTHAPATAPLPCCPSNTPYHMSRQSTHADTSPLPPPVQVGIYAHKNSFLHFMTNVCAIVGGVFTVSGIIDAFVYHGDRIIRKKMEMGKLF